MLFSYTLLLFVQIYVRLEVTIDRVREIKGNRVRTKGNFGQVGCTPGESSPIQRQLRTGWMNPMGIESELKATSDRLDEPNGNQVRTLRTFSENVNKTCSKKQQSLRKQPKRKMDKKISLEIFHSPSSFFILFAF